MSVTSRALDFASRWFDATTVDRVFAPLVADWQREWIDATPARRAWVSARGLAAFAFSVAILAPRILATPVPGRMRWSVTARIAAFCSVTGGLLCIPIVQSLARRSMEPLSLPLLVLFAMPVALALAFPFAMTLAIDAIRRDRRVPSQVERAAALKLALAAFVVLMVVNGYVNPAINQIWREQSTPAGWNVPGPGFAESSTLALLRHPDRNGPIVPAQYTRAREIRAELVRRSVLGILPAMLIWLRWQETTSRRAWYAPLPGVLATAAGVVAVMAFWAIGSILDFRGILPWALGLWAPIVGLLAIGLAVRAWSRPRSLSVTA